MPSTPRAQRQRTGQPAKNNRGVIAIRQAVEHPGRSLRASIARIGAKAGKGNGLQPAKFFRRRLDQQSDLPMAGVIAERDRLAVRRAHSALRAENEKLFAPDFAGFQPMPAFCVSPNRSPLGLFSSMLLGEGQASGRARVARVWIW